MEIKITAMISPNNRLITGGLYIRMIVGMDEYLQKE